MDNLVSCRKNYYYILGTGIIMYVLLRFIRNHVENISGFGEESLATLYSLITGYMDFFMVATKKTEKTKEINMAAVTTTPTKPRTSFVFNDVLRRYF